MNKLKMHSPNLTQENIARIRELFPSCVTEAHGSNGKLTLAVDFDQLRQELSESIVEGPQERYRLDWPGKREAMLAANAPIPKTLRPCREESVNFDSTKNLFIEGDNLDALKLLQETYLGKVKMIYIDPPYNTGNDFIYEDDFAETSEDFLQRSNQKDEAGNRLVANTESNGRFHSDWLSMMYPRLKLARNLLRDDGVIFISIDDGEVANLRRVCDEVFGVENFLSQIVWDLGTGTQAGHFTRSHEYILVYCKNKATLPNFDAISDDNIVHGALKKISRANPASEITFPSGFEFDGNNAIFTGVLGGSEQQFILSEKMEFHNGKLVQPVTIKAGWAMANQVRDYISGKETYDTKGQKVLRFFFNKQGILFYEKERGTYNPKSVFSGIANTKNGSTEVETIFGGSKFFDFPKPIELLRNLMLLATSNSDIILDFFSGSATTAHAVMQLNAEDGGNRQFIMVQLPEETPEDSPARKAGYATIAEIGKERIRRAGKKIVTSCQSSVVREEMERCGCVKLSRADCMAKGNGSSQASLFACQTAPQRGVVCSIESDAACGGVDSFQHSGGAGAQFKEGVHSVSIHSLGVEGGTGDATANLRQGQLPCKYGYFGSDGTSARGGQDAECPHFQTENCPLKTANSPDIGFRVLKVASSNMAEVYYAPDRLSQTMLDMMTDNIKPDRKPEDLLFQVLLDWGVEQGLALPIRKEQIQGKTVFFVNNTYLMACFNTGITEELVKTLAAYRPERMVFRDSGFVNDATRINVEQIFKQISPGTEVKVL